MVYLAGGENWAGADTSDDLDLPGQFVHQVLSYDETSAKYFEHLVGFEVADPAVAWQEVATELIAVVEL